MKDKFEAGGVAWFWPVTIWIILAIIIVKKSESSMTYKVSKETKKFIKLNLGKHLHFSDDGKSWKTARLLQFIENDKYPYTTDKPSDRYNYNYNSGDYDFKFCYEVSFNEGTVPDHWTNPDEEIK